MQNEEIDRNEGDKLSLNLAIIGGGRTCNAFLKIIRVEQSNYPNVRVLGVCDIDPKARGLATAREMGIFVTDKITDLFKIEGVDAVLELTNNQALDEIMRLKPAGVAVIEHDAGRLLETVFSVSRKLTAAEKWIDLEKRSYDILFQQTNIGVVVLAPDFSIIDANRAYLQAVKKTKEEAIGKPCHEIVKGFFAPCSYSQMGFECPVLHTLKTGESAIIIHEYPVSDSKTSYFNIATYPIKDKHGNIVRVIELWRDVTKEILSRWEKKLQRMEMDMKKMVQEDRMISLGRLVASCVHEINNPIQGLLTLSHLMQEKLEEGAPSPKDVTDFTKYISLMTTELERCGGIISGLLSFSRESSIEYKQEDLNDVLSSVIALTKHKMELSNIRLTTNTSDAPLIVIGDKNQLQQCVLNLIFNAIEAMPDGGDLIINAESESEKSVRIEIKDTGCGIQEEDLHHIFDPFFTTKEEGKGVGLGLSIVYGMVKSHKGDIKVKSRAGEGAAFVLRFPAASYPP